MEPWETAAREEIREIIARYALLGDRGKWAELAALFVPDGIFEINVRPHPFVGREAIAGCMASLGEGNVELPQITYVRHHVSNVTIDFESETAATGESYWHVIADIGLWRWGRYRDTYRRDDDGRWRFAHRVAREDRRVSA